MHILKGDTGWLGAYVIGRQMHATYPDALTRFGLILPDGKRRKYVCICLECLPAVDIEDLGRLAKEAAELGATEIVIRRKNNHPSKIGDLLTIDPEDILGEIEEGARIAEW